MNYSPVLASLHVDPKRLATEIIVSSGYVQMDSDTNPYLPDIIQVAIDRVIETLPESLTLLYILKAARDRAYEIDSDLEQARSHLSFNEIVSELHATRNHREYVGICDACRDDAGLFLEMAGNQ